MALLTQEQLNEHFAGQMAGFMTALLCLIETHPQADALKKSLAHRFSGRFDGTNPDVPASYEDGFGLIRQQIQRAVGGFPLLRPDKTP